MKMIFRWHGPKDPISLQYIRQIPGLYGIVSSLYDLPLGEVWPGERIQVLTGAAAAHGLRMEVVDSFRVHEEIKLGRQGREKLMPQYISTLKNLAASGIKVVCYNFMPVFDWTRTQMEFPLPDGSNTLSFEAERVEQLDVSKGIPLPGWGTRYTQEKLQALLDEYASVTTEQMWSNLEYFLSQLVPVAEELGLKLALHADDPPRPVFGLPRIIKNIDDHRRVLDIVDSTANGLTLCSGTLGSDLRNDVPSFINEFAARKRVHFVHLRNVKVGENGDFYESAHLTQCGSLDMAEIVKALHDADFQGYARPDHGRMIWGETGVPGYGLYDRALGIMYLQGLWEGIGKEKTRALAQRPRVAA
ncbi:mannonate dehydratase [Paraburkholderia caffeinilytica]|uniref:mannonate dehydratase n=1 Tax=Paraburkholderia caffeinilytica TaxID=1761016 RepID=UPI003D9FF0B7